MATPARAIRYEDLVQADRIHGSLYTDPRIFADELERIFSRGWVFVGHESEIPTAGDFVTREVGAQPVILVRGPGGEVSVLLNRCAHRGTAVCTAARGTTRVFTCPYHGWTYDLGGALAGVPYPGAYDGPLDRSGRGLARAPRVARYRGFVFASLSPDGVSLEEHLGPAARLIDRACDLSPEGDSSPTSRWARPARSSSRNPTSSWSSCPCRPSTRPISGPGGSPIASAGSTVC
jgi:fatty-acyl-CoA synthase